MGTPWYPKQSRCQALLLHILEIAGYDVLGRTQLDCSHAMYYALLKTAIIPQE